MSDDAAGGRPAPKTRAGIMPRPCPERSKLVEALLRGENPECRPKKPERKYFRFRPSVKDLIENDE